jgi:quercetin dioxygenase-like cupin family protein
MQSGLEVMPREVKILRREEGQAFDLLGVCFLKKVKSGETDGNFCVFQVVIPPGASVPLHHHPYAEAVYVLMGRPYFFRMKNGVEQWSSAGEGETVVIPPGAMHGVRNRDRRPARLLIIANGRHESSFEAAGAASDGQPSAPTSEVEGPGMNFRSI